MISEKQLTIGSACKTANVSRSGYYKWRLNEEVIDNDVYLRKEIQGIILEFPFYGYRRITKELYRRGIQVNHKRILRIMKENNLVCRRKKSFKPVTTQSDHDCRVYPNLTKDLKVTGLNKI